jgi:hypothetical protein
MNSFRLQVPIKMEDGFAALAGYACKNRKLGETK